MLGGRHFSSKLTVVLLVALVLLLPSFAVTPAVAAAYPKFITSVDQFCSCNDLVTAVVSGAGGVFIEDGTTGSLYHWDNTNGLTLVTNPPTSFGDSYGMAVIKMKTGLRVALSSLDGALYYCDGVTATSVSKCKAITLSSTFCSKMSMGTCQPAGLAFDKNKNLYYVDPINGVEVELTAKSGYTIAGVTQHFPAGDLPFAIFIDTSTTPNIHWVADHSCDGNIFHDGIFLAPAGAGVTALSISKKNPSATGHLYAAVSAPGLCGVPSPAYIVDVSDGVGSPPIPSTSLGAGSIWGLSSGFFFSAETSTDSGAIYQTVDTA